MSQFYHIGGVFPGRHWSSLVIIGRHRLSLAVIGSHRFSDVPPIQGGSTVYRNRPPVAVGVTFQSLQSVSIRLDPRIYHRMTDESRKSRMMNDEAILNSNARRVSPPPCEPGHVSPPCCPPGQKPGM